MKDFNKTKNDNKYNNTYKKDHYKRVTILVPYKEENLLSYLNSKSSKSGYILELIKEDMKKNS